MSKTTKNIIILTSGIAVYLFTIFVYGHVSLFAAPLFKLYASDSSFIRGLADIMTLLLFTPALRILTVILCLIFLFIVNKKKRK
ncbi:hypothetical protein D920_00982 [Enterococcus faecalis 13-SD-W-01]|nr:hypothetical protein D920_00982 [Enterococcus faecalis 13-SD-W-01]